MDIRSNDWDPCPRGKLHQMVRQRQARRRRRLVDRAAVTAATVLLLVVAGVAVISFISNSIGESTPHFGGIACAEVRDLLPQYAAGSLDAETAAKVDTHLEECPHCRPLWEEMRSRMQAVSQFLWNTVLLGTPS